MLLTFSKLLDEIIEQTKRQTIRLAPNHRNGRFSSFYLKKKYHPIDKASYQELIAKHGLKKTHKNIPYITVYWKNPRNGGMKIGCGCIIGVKTCTTKDLTVEDAKLDGFYKDPDPLKALLNTLSELHGDIENVTWEVVYFDWIDCPPKNTKDVLIKEGLYP